MAIINYMHNRYALVFGYSLSCMLIIFYLLFCYSGAFAAIDSSNYITVSHDGKGDFKTIQEAIEKLPVEATRPRVIFIKNGVYNEKVFINKNFVTLIGESRVYTVVMVSESRDVWRTSHSDDWGAATINIKGNDVTLENMSIINSYGLHVEGATNRTYLYDKKVSSSKAHQMALRSFSTTRLIAKNCIFKSGGGDTVSPWNKESGMYYFKNCIMEGYVDFYCPRGWAYAENCVFICHGHTAAIWHDGSANENAKSVFVNCKFQGDKKFKLGRYHWDAQIYFIGCNFSEYMDDAAIYFVAPEGRTLKWGERIYFYNCQRQGGNYTWHKNNLDKKLNHPSPEMINEYWAFDGKWNPLTFENKK